MKSLILICLIALLSVGLLSCSDNEDIQDMKSEKDIKGITYVVSVKGRKLSTDQFKRYLKFETLSYEDEQLDNEMLSHYLERFIEHHFLLDEAAAQNINVNEAELQKAVDSMKNEVGSAEGAEKFPYFENKDWQQHLKEQMIVQKYVDWFLTATVVVSHDEEDAFFKKKYGRKFLKRMYKLAQIVMPDKQTADETHKNLLKDKSRFASFAKKFSQFSFGDENGDIGWYTLNQLPETVSQAVRRLRKGQVSKVLESDNGYLIIMLKDIKRQKRVDRLQVQESLRRELLQEKREKYLVQHLSKIWKSQKNGKPEVQIYQENLNFIYIPQSYK